MEVKELINNYKILGVIGNYQSSLEIVGKVKDLNIKNIDKAIKMVNLDSSLINSELNKLTISELWKVDLMTKLDKDIIIIGNLYNSLIYKDIEFMKKLFIKLSNDYDKKIIVIDNNLKTFFNLTNKVVCLDKKNIVLETDNFYDKELFNYIKKPPIIEFINYVNKDRYILNENIDIYELIKDIYRSVS